LSALPAGSYSSPEFSTRRKFDQPILAARSQYLLDLLAQVPDPRKRRGRRHALAGLLAVGIVAVIAGSRSFAAIGQWAADAGPEVLAVLGAAGSCPGPPSVSTDHGRWARRTVKTVLTPAWIEFEGAAQVAQLRRTVTKKGKRTVEVVYLITSDRDAEPAVLAAWARGHWHIENKLHWVRDVTYQEDKSLVRAGNAPRVMASLRSLAISLLRLDGHANIAAANRHHARDPQRTLKLLQAA
jgi:predicted transposase YbfD/YdcC